MYLLTHERKTFKILCWSTSIVFFPLTGTTDYDVLWTVVSSSLLKFKVLSFHWNVTSNYFILIIQSQRYFLQEKNQEKLYYLSCGGKKKIPSLPPESELLFTITKIFFYMYQQVPLLVLKFCCSHQLVSTAFERKARENVTTHWTGQWHWGTSYQPIP